MYIRVYSCTYMYIYVHTYTYMYIHIHICTYTRIYARICAFTYIDIHICTYIHIYAHSTFIRVKWWASPNDLIQNVCCPCRIMLSSSHPHHITRANDSDLVHPLTSAGTDEWPWCSKFTCAKMTVRWWHALVQWWKLYGTIAREKPSHGGKIQLRSDPRCFICRSPANMSGLCQSPTSWVACPWFQLARQEQSLTVCMQGSRHALSMESVTRLTSRALAAWSSISIRGQWSFHQIIQWCSSKHCRLSCNEVAHAPAMACHVCASVPAESTRLGGYTGKYERIQTTIDQNWSYLYQYEQICNIKYVSVHANTLTTYKPISVYFWHVFCIFLAGIMVCFGT